ncbi:hypothetical protein [Nitrospira sp. Kam-Ns4a]
MLLAGLFGGLLLVALVLGDWIHFTSLTAPASRYGCPVARREDRLPLAAVSAAAARFGPQDVLALPHGIARLFRKERRILLRPQYRLFALRFRTAWPIKGSIELVTDGEAARLVCAKRVPWSSAVLTLAWFAVVTVGTVAFVVAYLLNGGLSSLLGVLLGLGIAGLGLLVLAFGLIVVSLAYRLEDHRFMQAYEELRAALTGEPPAAGA